MRCVGAENRCDLVPEPPVIELVTVYTNLYTLSRKMLAAKQEIWSCAGRFESIKGQGSMEDRSLPAFQDSAAIERLRRADIMRIEFSEGADLRR